ncbi:MAG: hypothetical protein AB1486_06460 [Planctomycetota bacterium]
MRILPRVTVLALLVVCACVVALVLRPWGLPESAVSQDKAPMTPSGPPNHGVAEHHGGASDQAERLELSPEPGQPAGDQAAEEVMLDGVFVVVDESGQEHSDKSGRFTLVARAGDDVEWTEDVQVSAGCWRTTLPEKVELEVTRPTLGGQEVVVDQARWSIPADHHLVIHGRLVNPLILHVLGAQWLDELQDVTVVVRPRTLFSDERPYPGEYSRGEILAESVGSPIALKPGAECSWQLHSAATLWAKAPGHAWGTTELADFRNGEGRLILKRAGELEVSLVTAGPAFATRFGLAGGDQGSLPGAHLMLRLREVTETADHESQGSTGGQGEDDGSQDLARWLLECQGTEGRSPEQLKIDKPRVATILATGFARALLERPILTMEPVLVPDLNPGRYRVSVELGTSDTPVVLGSTFAEVRSGSRTSVVIEVTNPPEPQDRASLSGTLRLPAAWGMTDVRLFITLRTAPGDPVESCLCLRDMGRSPTDPDLHSWDAGLVVPGVYELEVFELGITKLVDVVPPGRSDVELTVGEPAQVELRLIDAESGQDVRFRWISCSGCPTKLVEFDPVSGTYRFVAPVGEIVIDPSDLGWQHLSRKVAIHPGQNVILLEVSRACGVKVACRRDGELLQWDQRWYVDVKEVDGDGEMVSKDWWSGQGAYYWVSVAHPGLYDVQVVNTAGEVACMRVRVSPGEFAECIITLDR